MASSICNSVSPKPSEWVKGNLVGSGSFGTVHLAMNKSTGGLFVVKSGHSGAGCEALNNEVKILNSLSPSPYIVRCLGADYEEERDGGCGGGILNVFMEYMAGGSLADVAQKFGGSLDEEVVRVYTREILHGLQHLHRQAIVHCDLKCKNVLLGSSGNIKLADFGCAKRVAGDLKGLPNGRKQSVLGGTPLWMAPEVLRNDHEALDAAADIWSLGCTVIEMATGRPPWAAEVSNPMAALLKIAHSDGIPQLPPHFSKDGLDFLARCLERDPKKRCTADELLCHPFVSRNNHSTRPSHKEYASSPTSVLEVQAAFEDTYDSELDEVESPQGKNDFKICNSFSRFVELDGMAIWQEEDSALGSSVTWIIVRSG